MATTKFSPVKTIRNQSTQGNKMNEATNIIIKDVEFHWVKIAKPIDSFDGSYQQWEVQVQVPKKREKELSIYGKVKEQPNGKVSINFRKKSEKADGSPAQKVRCVDGDKEPLDPTIIGNGSKGSVLLMLKDYEITGKNGKVTKSGTSATLIAIQVSNLIVYEKSNDNFVDFDEVPTKGAKVPKKSKEVSDDDIPF
jgi:hypothetical protein